MTENPYSSPEADLQINSDIPDAEAIRREYISHESSLRSVGLLYLVGGGVMIVGGVMVLVGTLMSSFSSNSPNDFPIYLMIIFYLIFGVAFWWLGRGLRKLDSGTRRPAIILACIGLLGIPLGTLIHGYILYLFLSKRGKFVFSDDYRQVIDSTPHITYKTSRLVWILLVLLVIAIGGAIIAGIVTSTIS